MFYHNLVCSSRDSIDDAKHNREFRSMLRKTYRRAVGTDYGPTWIRQAGFSLCHRRDGRAGTPHPTTGPRHFRVTTGGQDCRSKGNARSIRRSLRIVLRMSPGLVLYTNDCPETPDPVVQKQYRSIVAKIQFAAHWIRFDISYAAAQLARLCASAGPSHWAALTHLVGFLVHRPASN